MFITGLKLYGCIRLIHNNIPYIEIDFTSPYQIFLGTNGSGKSTILSQLTPYPSHKDMFTSDGYRELYFNHKGHKWIVRDDFSTNTHSITKDGEVIYEKLNPTMMQNVVFKLFGIDKTLSMILTDVKKLTNLTPNERRDIIMRASKINVELGLANLEKIKTRRSYLKEYVKNINKRLLTENNNIPTETHIQELENRKADILHDLKVLEEYSTNLPDEIMDERTVRNLLEEVERKGKKDAYRFMDTPKCLHGAKDNLDAGEIILQIKIKIAGLKTAKEKLAETIEDLKATLGTSRFSKTLSDLEAEKDTLTNKISELEKSTNGFIYIGEDYLSAVNSSKSLYEELREIFSSMADNTDRRFTKERRNANAEKIIKLNNRLHMLNNSVISLEHDLKLHKEGEMTQCPSCKFNFIPGVQLSESELLERLKENNKLIAELEIELNSEKEYEVAIREFLSCLQELENLSRHYHQHQSLFTALKTYNYSSNPPAGCLNIIEKWFSDIGLSINYNQLSERLSKVIDELAMAKVEDFQKRELENQRLDKINLEYSNLIDQTEKAENDLRQANDYIAYVKNLRDFIEEAEKTSIKVDEYLDNSLAEKMNRFVFSTKASLNNELANIEKEIVSISYTILNRDNLQKDLNTAEIQLKNTGILIDELSPKTGLLGDAMNEFIDKFVKQMNNFIKSVWTYKVEVQSCRNKKGDLDWYFPVSVRGAKPSPDVALMSTGEQHICNWVFKLLIMTTYDLMDYPLFLDELAGNMDPVHRIRIMKTIYDMVANGFVPQMFLISHYEQQHGVFNQAETLITNAENLQVLPAVYNQHVKFS